LRFLLGGIGNDEAALGRLVAFNATNKNPVVE
jgi:hypothetical protein